MKKIYGLIGYPLEHSFSKGYFNSKFTEENISAEYQNFELEKIDDLKNHIEIDKIYGLNVTIPHKSSIIKQLDEIDDEAKEVGAVNVIKFIRNGSQIILKGYNSDVIGFTDSIKPLLENYNKKALILGTGGVSKAIKFSLDKLGIESIFVSRNNKPGCITYEMLNKNIMEDYNIIVNASPVGMYPNINSAPQIPYEYITSKHVVFDTIYNPLETKFLKLAAEQGAKVKNGLEMLEKQAIAAWKIWNDEQ
jgi:shikimate dehydrogenase